MKYSLPTLYQNVVETMELSKKINQRNLDGLFRLILLIYGRIMKKYLSKFIWEN